MGATTVTASDLRSNLSDALDSVSRNNIVIITRRGKKDRAIVDVDMLEDLLAASQPAYLAQIKKARAGREYLSHQDVFGDI
jgi:prevent-host-death family protein